MKAVLLVTEEKENREEVKYFFPGEYFLIESKGDAHSWKLLKNLDRCVVLADIDWRHAPEWLQEAQKVKPDLVYVGLGRDKEKAARLSGCLYDFIQVPFEPWMLKKTLDRSWEKAGRLTEREDSNDDKMLAERQLQLAQGYPSRPWARVLSDFSRALSNQFNKDKFLDLFLDAVNELVPVAKLSVLLKAPHSGDYFIAVQRGLDPDIHEKFRFKPREGIISWLSEEGRILHFSEAAGQKGWGYSPELIQELKMLNAQVCIPLLAYGQLAGVLCLGSKVAGAPFYEKELELLYTICGNIAIALNDIDLHERLYNQKIYTESILQLMNSGVVAINNEDKITTFNQRAGEILSSEPDKMLGSDLRNLPSPLGDLLYETLITSRPYHKEEVKLPRDGIPLELSTYRMVNSEGEVLGSVMIFDDITSRKQAELEKRQVEQMEVLNRFVSQLTHEIKNPMVAIQTFSQMLPEKYDDSSFRDFFSQTVKQELKRLNELIDQLIAFSSAVLYKHEAVDTRELVETAVALLHEQGISRGVPLKTEYCDQNPKVMVDKLNMSRAFSYLLKYLFETMEKGGTITVKTLTPRDQSHNEVVTIAFMNSGSKINPEDVEGLFNPLEIRPDNTISLELPVSKKIIEDHGGKLRIKKPNGKFLEFEVQLPVFTNQYTNKGEKENEQQG